ncbi:MAG TPA: DUF1045 domain-containing protein [Reyranella sp.]
MTERFAIYFAPARESLLGRAAETWLARAELAHATVSARRYGFHATLKAPMGLATGCDRAGLEARLGQFAQAHAAVALGRLAPRVLDGFIALTAEPQPQAVTDFAAEVVEEFEPYRAPLTAGERERRLAALLTPRQVELVDGYGYPYVLEEFLFHMTLTDRLADADRGRVLERAAEWFAPALAEPIALDRLVLFHEAEAGAAFRRLGDHVLGGSR